MPVTGFRAVWEKYGQKITLAALAGVLTFVTGLYELAYKAYDARRDRDTITYLSSLAVRDMERGEYDEAEKYVAAAEQIDLKSFTLITTRATLNALKLVDQRWKSDRAVPEDTVFQLEDLGLSEDEANFCMAMSAVTNHNAFYKEAGDYFDAVQHDERLVLLKRLRAISHVDMPQISTTKDDEKKKKIDELLGKLTVLDTEISEAARAHPLEFWKSPLKRQFANPMHTDVMACKNTLQNLQATLAPAAAASDAAVIKLEQLKRTLPVNSPLATVADDQLQRTYVQQQEAKNASASQSDLDSTRLKAIALKNGGNYDEARKMLQGIIARYESEKRKPDQTLYYTHFSLGLMEEYHYSDLKAAEHDYTEAEEIADGLKLNDPNIANSLGYFYYRQARSEQDPARRRALIDNARTQLKRIDSKFGKTLFTLQKLDQLDNTAKVTTEPTPRAAS